jgi:hypothetical protein
MKISHFILSILLMSALMFLPACYEDSNTGPENYNKSDNLIKAEIEGDVALDFTAKSMNYYQDSTYSRFSATMIVNPFEIYSLEISFPDSVDHYSFNLTKTDTLTNFKVYIGNIVKEYYFRNIQGTIDFDKRNQDTMTGVFSFFAEDSLLKKSIIVKDGIFKFIKKKKV